MPFRLAASNGLLLNPFDIQSDVLVSIFACAYKQQHHNSRYLVHASAGQTAVDLELGQSDQQRLCVSRRAGLVRLLQIFCKRVSPGRRSRCQQGRLNAAVRQVTLQVSFYLAPEPRQPQSDWHITRIA